MNKSTRILAVSPAKAYKVNPLKATMTAILVTGLIDLKDATISLFLNLFRIRCVIPNKIATSVKNAVHKLSNIIEKCRCIVANVTRLTSQGWHTVLTTVLGTFLVNLGT